jgi:hypothetical protein
MYNSNTVVRYFEYKIQLKHNIIQQACLKHVSYYINYTNQSILYIKLTNQLLICPEHKINTQFFRQDM